ncbi:hypothetical protein [Vibrio sagamiensis]|uniref:Uncharacterized protein n=1 Tax=Vibrio sagamiensis NBRC 104589 TaxID=1219064 RepID=A0A511QDG5_9VIBR|nr:hypothetical protein [Vibrio sagamiensis]PNQ54025.1 hypothetical protein C1141_18075 [Vibrio agarivorans]GEM75345.1 hypothetical protein VSA01S_14570 [Vibrio sagamiensis NBRC 104589]
MKFSLNTANKFGLHKKVFKVYSIGDVVVAIKGINLGELVVTGQSSGGSYTHVKTSQETLTYPTKDLKKA